MSPIQNGLLYAKLLMFKNGPFMPLRFVTSFLNFPCMSVESFARLYVKTSTSFFSYDTETTRTTYQVPGTYTAAVRTAAAVVYSRYSSPRWY